MRNASDVEGAATENASRIALRPHARATTAMHRVAIEASFRASWLDRKVIVVLRRDLEAAMIELLLQSSPFPALFRQGLRGYPDPTPDCLTQARCTGTHRANCAAHGGHPYLFLPCLVDENAESEGHTTSPAESMPRPQRGTSGCVLLAATVQKAGASSARQMAAAAAVMATTAITGID